MKNTQLQVKTWLVSLEGEENGEQVRYSSTIESLSPVTAIQALREAVRERSPGFRCHHAYAE